MKTVLSLTAALILSAFTASAQVYECEFNPRQTRGWAPEKLYVDTNRSLAFGYTQEGARVTGSNPYFWRETLRSTGGTLNVRYRVRLGQGIESGDSVPSWIQIEVKRTQGEETLGRCKLYTG